jgi:hypothetical protein
MANLPTNRSTSSTTAEHVADHNTLHAFHNLIDAKGDLVAGTAADTAGKLGVGANGTVLTADSGEATGIKWAAAAGLAATLFDAKGDLIAATAADTAARLAVGANGTVLTAASGEATGLQWAAVDLSSKADALVTANRQTGSYTLVIGDAGKVIEMNVAGANNLTVPLNSSVAFAVGTIIELFQYGAGQTTVVATGGVTIRSSGGKLKLTGQYSGASLRKIATDEWALVGDIAT